MPGFAPLSSGNRPSPFNPFAGVPVLGDQSSPVGLLANLALQPYMQSVFGSHGLAPMGMQHDVNLSDSMRRQQFTNQQQQLLRQVAEEERSNFMRTFRGVGAMTGTPWGAQQEAAAASLSGYAVSASPFVAQMAPGVLEAFGGFRGSATVMANNMLLGSRYRMDPVTGRVGFSVDSNAALVRATYDDLYRQPGMPDMQGVTAGKAGEMYDELTRRGLMPGMTATQLDRRTRDALRGLRGSERDRVFADARVVRPPNGDFSALSDTQLDSLRQQDPVAGRLRSVDSKQVGRTLKEYSDVVAAMRELFGEMGEPNAPIPKLLEGLEQLTQGGLGRLDPTRLASIVRTTQQLARQSGMSIEAVQMLREHAGARAIEMGLDPTAAIDATQGAIAWGVGLRASGAMEQPVWGRGKADQLLMMDQGMRLQAQNSEMANRLGMLLRVRQTVGGFQAGSAAERMATAIDTDQTTFMDPSRPEGQQLRNLLDVSKDELTAILQGTKSAKGQALNLDAGQMQRLLNDKTGNAEFTQERVVDIVRRSQPIEASRTYLAAAMTGLVMEQLQKRGTAPGELSDKANAVVGPLIESVLRIAPADLADPELRTVWFQRAMQSAMTKAGKPITDAEGRALAATMMSVVEETAKTQGKTAPDLLTLMNPELLNEGTRLSSRAKFEGDVSKQLSGLGSPLQRAMEALQRGEDGMKVLGLALGGVPTDEVGGKLTPLLEDVQSKVDELTKAHDAMLAAKPGSEASQRAAEELAAKRRGLADAVNVVRKRADDWGLVEPTVKPEDFQRAEEAQLRLKLARMEYAAIASGDDPTTRVSEAELQAVRTSAIGGDEKDVQRYVRSRRVDQYVDANFAKLMAEDDLSEAEARKRLRATGEAEISIGDQAGMRLDAETLRLTDADHRRIAVLRRSRDGLQPTAEQIELARKQTPNQTDEEATLLAAGRLQANQLGLTGMSTGWKLLGQLDSHFQAAHAKLFEVSDAELQPWLDKGFTRDAAKQRVVDFRLLQVRGNLEEGLSGPSGGAVRAAAGNWAAETLGIAAKFRESKDMSLLGPEGTAAYATIERGQAELQQLAEAYAGGDMQLLLAGGVVGTNRDFVAGELSRIFEEQTKARGTFENFTKTGGWKSGEAEAYIRKKLGVDGPLSAQQRQAFDADMTSAKLVGRMRQPDLKTIALLRGDAKYLDDVAAGQGMTRAELVTAANTGNLDEALTKTVKDFVTKSGELTAKLQAPSLDAVFAADAFRSEYAKSELTSASFQDARTRLTSLLPSFGVKADAAKLEAFAGLGEGIHDKQRLLLLEQVSKTTKLAAEGRAKLLGDSAEEKKLAQRLRGGDDDAARAVSEEIAGLEKSSGGDEKKLLAQLRQKFGLTSDSAAKNLLTATKAHRATGLLDAELDDPEKMADALQAYLHAGRFEQPGAAGAARHLTIDGNLTISGDGQARLKASGDER